MLQGVGAVVAGFVAMTIVVMAGSMALMAAFVPGGLAAMKTMRDNPSTMPKPTPRYYVMNITLSLVAAMLGGWLTGRIAGPQPQNYLVALAVVILAMGLVSAFSPGSGMQPKWYKLLIPVIGVAGIALSTLLLR
jgi:peptidoglycan/LPS O-acetylase OafA/YrhL